MKVLLVVSDLYKNVGGGQTVYGKLVASAPDVEFCYFQVLEPEGAVRPANATPIPMAARRNLRALTPPPYPSFQLHALEAADQIARSVAGQSFDIVDIPDFETQGSHLRDAFAHHNVTVGRIVLALHGNISKSIELNWGSAGDQILELQMLERAQFDAADGVYGISTRYIRDWQSVIDRPVSYIDPAHFMAKGLPAGTGGDAGGDAAEPPSVYCIGRSERRKGNDLFVEMMRWIDRGAYGEAAHIGDRDFSYNGIGSDSLLDKIAKARGLDIEHRPSMSRAQLAALFAGTSIIVLPVRYDTLNLVALEALFAGCPVAVSDKAGVCDYLDEAHPGLPYVKLDLDNIFEATEALRELVENYPAHRAALRAYLAKARLEPAQPLDIRAVYAEALANPARRPEGGHHLLEFEDRGQSILRRTIHLARPVYTRLPLRDLRRIAAAPKHFVASKIRQSRYFGDARYVATLMDSRRVRSRLRDVARHPEISEGALRQKLDATYDRAQNPLFRCNFWLEIARIERLLGHDLMAATYELRALRLLGEDRFDLLPATTATLLEHGFEHEAAAITALYQPGGNPAERVYAYLQQSYQRNLGRQDKPLEMLDDRRDGTPKVSVIVSLYNAADKLERFLDALRHQTLLRAGQVEVVLVDSGSPTDERGVFEAYAKTHPLNVVYARSAERETIQAAWNRGIGLARAPYLVFLGVDETIYPEALEVLAGELDADPSVDWAMANSLVTEVDEQGLLKIDVMPYDRTGATKRHTYLETCYISWVGGMYRKSIHDRFGYYDETFGAAGDTEFKNRILPKINVKFVDQVLGLFLNYPDGQTTASPKAEIEDTRAWYLHRTPGGVRYAFEDAPVDEAEELLALTLGYRKSFCGHLSSDIEYAAHLAAYLAATPGRSALADKLNPSLSDMLATLRRLELVSKMPGISDTVVQMGRAWRRFSGYEKEHRALLSARGLGTPSYNVLNDNRYEQHSWLWKSEL